jgi:hypothetical protein
VGKESWVEDGKTGGRSMTIIDDVDGFGSRASIEEDDVSRLREKED